MFVDTAFNSASVRIFDVFFNRLLRASHVLIRCVMACNSSFRSYLKKLITLNYLARKQLDALLEMCISTCDGYTKYLRKLLVTNQAFYKK